MRDCLICFLKLLTMELKVWVFSMCFFFVVYQRQKLFHFFQFSLVLETLLLLLIWTSFEDVNWFDVFGWAAFWFSLQVVIQHDICRLCRGNFFCDDEIGTRECTYWHWYLMIHMNNLISFYFMQAWSILLSNNLRWALSFLDRKSELVYLWSKIHNFFNNFTLPESYLISHV